MTEKITAADAIRLLDAHEATAVDVSGRNASSAGQRSPVLHNTAKGLPFSYKDEACRAKKRSACS